MCFIKILRLQFESKQKKSIKMSKGAEHESKQSVHV